MYRHIPHKEVHWDFYFCLCTAKNDTPVCQMPHRGPPSLRPCGPSAASAVLRHLCYWYHSLSHFSCRGEAQASKLGPTDPALLSAALNINARLRGPVNTRYMQRRSIESEEQAARFSHVLEDGVVQGSRRNERLLKQFEKSPCITIHLLHLLSVLI